MAVTFNAQGIVSGYQRDDITFKTSIAVEGRVQIPSNYESTRWKVIKIAGSILTLGLAPLLYFVSKWGYEKVRLLIGELYSLKKIDSDEDFSDPVLIQLKEMMLLGSGSYVKLNEVLNEDKDFKNKFLLCAQHLPTDEELKEALKAKKSIIIPIILKGGFFVRGIYSVKHITAMIINPNTREIIYIDPKGKTLADYSSCKVLANSFDDGASDTKTISEVFNQVIKKISESRLSYLTWTLVQNRKHYQYDAYNCGVHFLHNARSFVIDDKIPLPLNSLHETREERKFFIDIFKPYISATAQQQSSSQEPVSLNPDGDDFGS